MRVEIAGMRAGDFHISLEDGILSIYGRRMDVAKPRAYHQMEVNFGGFVIRTSLPCPVKTDGVRAEYREGFLKVILPKSTPTRVEVGD